MFKVVFALGEETLKESEKTYIMCENWDIRFGYLFLYACHGEPGRVQAYATSFVKAFQITNV